MLTDTRPIARQVSYDNIDYERGYAHLINWQLFLRIARLCCNAARLPVLAAVPFDAAIFDRCILTKK